MPPVTRATRPLPSAVLVVGFVSLLNDFASEMVIPLVPILLATTLSAGALALGIIEGVADAVSNLLKLWAGRRSDSPGQQRKGYVVVGYLLSNAVRPLIALATSWWIVLGIRVVDRVGKGVRTAPRDALLADLARDDDAGRVYGVTRALDHTGAVLGALVAAAVLYWGTQRIDLVIAFSAIPGLLAVALFAIGIKEALASTTRTSPPPPLAWSVVSEPARRYLLTMVIFTLGRIPESFLLLRGHELGMGVVELLLLWAALHVVKAAISQQAGTQTDRIGRRPLIFTGWIVYAIAALALAFVQEPMMLWAWTLLLGFYFGMTEGAERVLVRDLSAPAERGTAFGWFHMLVGMAAIPAGLLLGGLWAFFGAQSAFLVSCGVALLASAGFWRWVR
jgi:MFS family permease